MAPRTLEYQLVEGYVVNWLVAGPSFRPVEGPPGERRPAEVPTLAETPVDRGTFALSNQAEPSQTWRYLRCQPDRLVDVSQFAPVERAYLAWAFAGLHAPRPGPVSLVFTASGPAELWLNGESVARIDGPTGQRQTVRAPAELSADNQLLVRLEGTGSGSIPLAAAVRLEDMPEQPPVVRIQTNARFPHRQVKLERAFDDAYLEQVTNHRGAHFNLRFSEGFDEDLRFAYQVQDADGMIYVEGTGDIPAKEPLDVGHTYRLYERPFRVVLRAVGKEYYEQEMRYQAELPIEVLDNAYTIAPYGSYTSRRKEAFEDAAKRDDWLFGQIARMALGRWSEITPQVILDAAARAVQGAAGSQVELVGLLGMLYRYGGDPAFAPGVLDPVETAMLRLTYEPDEETGRSQSLEILRLAAEILAGQRYAEQAFAASGLTGSQHQARAVEQARDWLRERGETGFAEWDSDVAFERMVVALTHLASLAADNDLRELAAVLLDKLLFLMAVNSFQGALGGTRGLTQPSAVKSGQLAATAGLARLLWGTGVYTRQMAGTISLATSDYEFPSFFADVANQQEPESWGRERHAGPSGEVNKVVYRTPDYLLSSAQDYRPGQPGQAELVWQAALGPDAVVFTNHPACFKQDASRQPGFWLGNEVLPRVAQWKDSLIAVYNLPDDSWLDFTHAFFPTFEFEEHVLEGGWAFARLGEGYLALTAARPFELIGRMPDGQRELRSTGRQNVWVCHMGRAAVDGSFADFRRKVLALPVEWRPLGVQLTNLRGAALSFGWEEPFQVNGEKTLLAGFRHVEHPHGSADFPAQHLDINFGDILLRLDFA